MSVLLYMLPGCLLSFAAAQPVPVILDTDLGDDIDDTWALCMLLGCPHVNLKLVVTASDDTEQKTRLVAKILEKVGRTDIPIGTGVKTSDNPIHQAKWLGDYTLERYPGTVHEDGVEAMIGMIRATKGPITLLVIGPQTNLREALKRDPSIAQNARVVAMAGSVHTGYNGKPGRSREYNVSKDVDAARAVFAAPWEIVMAPLDSCGTLRLTGERYAQVAQSNEPRAQAVVENYRNWTRFGQFPEGESSVLFDTVAGYLAFDDALCRMETVKLSIDDEGRTVPDERGRPVRCALEWQDREAFEDLLVQCLTSKTARPTTGVAQGALGTADPTAP